MAELSQRELADLIARYYRRKIGILMQQAEHWAKHGKLLAVHHRLHKADAYYQIVSLCERFALAGRNPFDAMLEELASDPVAPLGTYPPSPDLYRYRDVGLVAAELAALTARSEPGGAP